jgi:hypothetical protein
LRDCVIARIAALGIGLLSLAPAAAGEATLSLPQPATTSAGVFDAEGRLLKTLWRGRTLAAGPVAIRWDGRDEDGEAVSAGGSYTVRLMSHRVRHVWEGVIGNTSREREGAGVHRAFHPIHDMAIDAAGNAYYAVGYNELQHALFRFRTADPQAREALAKPDYQRLFRSVASDGERVYVANAGSPESFVIALRASDGKPQPFAQGRLVFDGVNHGNRWDGVIDWDRDERRDGSISPRAPAGIAVQQRGRVLFVTHPGTGEVRLFDKRSGARLGHLEMQSPIDVAVAPDDSLWVLCSEGGMPVLVRYREQAGGWTRSQTIGGDLIRPLALGVSPRDGLVVVADGGSEQLKAWDDAGRRGWTLGREGGYRQGGPEVSVERYGLSAGPTYVAFQSDGSFWFGDPANARNLHFDDKLQYVEQIMYLPASYASAVDFADPTRVFSGLLEFAVDYAKPLRESWRLVRNWGAGPAPRQPGGAGRAIAMVATLGNGRTYALMSLGPGAARELVELTAQGVRKAGAAIEPGTRLHADGSLRTSRLRFGEMRVLAREVRGFAPNGDPEWGPWEEIARAPANEGRDPHVRGLWFVPAAFPQTAGGIVVSFSPWSAPGFHLGGIRRGARGWLWRSSPSGTWTLDRQGRVTQGDGSFETGRGVQYAGSMVTASGRDIVFGYHGEAWNGGQANQWMHYQEDGLFVGQFGTPAYAWQVQQGAVPAAAGNAFSPSLVRVGTALYLWHNDESVHGGLHRWRIEGLDTVERHSAPIVP